MTLKQFKESLVLVDRVDTALTFTQPSLTEQSHAKECDINRIINRFTKTGQITHLNNREMQYGFAPETDLKTSLDLVKNLRREFEELSPEKQEMFDNNFENYAAFLSDYEESPESFMFDSEAQTDTSVSEKEKTAEKSDSGSSDEV